MSSRPWRALDADGGEEVFIEAGSGAAGVEKEKPRRGTGAVAEKRVVENMVRG
jgi:hypothetical protein